MFFRGRVHYAWVIVAIAAAMGFITSSVRFAAAALVPHLSDPAAGFGWSYGAISLAFSLQWIIFGLASPTWAGLATVTEFAGSCSLAPYCSSPACCSPVP